MKVVITGGAGFVGSNLGLHLSKLGHEVLLLDDLSHGSMSNISNECGTFRNIDVRRKYVLEPYFENVDIVYHLAAISNLALCQADPLTAFDVNVNGTINVLEEARKSGVKTVVFSSSSAVMENGIVYPGTRGSHWAPPDLVYSMTKSTGEDICQSYIQNYNIDVRIVRIYNAYGPHQDYKRLTPPLVPYLVNCALNFEQPIIYGEGSQRRDFIYIDDVVEALEKTATSEKLSLFPGWLTHIGTGTNYSVLQIWEMLKNITRSDASPIFKLGKEMWDVYPTLFEGPNPLNKPRVAQEASKETLAPTFYSRKLLDWTPKISMEEGLNMLVDSMGENYNVETG